MSQRTYELQQEQLNSQASQTPTYEENLTAEVNAMTELERKRRAAQGYRSTDTTGGLLSSSSAATKKKQLLGG